MTPVVHILSTVRRHQLLPAALLVFKTLRVGWPTARVVCYPNDLTNDPRNEAAIVEAATAAGCELAYGHEATGWTHPGWIRHVIQNNSGTHVICDTDMIFYDKVEDWEFESDTAIAGWRIPAFKCPYSKSVTRSRLHTCLQWINCGLVSGILRAEENGPELVPCDLISPQVYFSGGQRCFHDTTGSLFHALHKYWPCYGLFPEQLDAFTHLFSGTLVDVVGPCVPGLASMHRLAYEDSQAVRGAWRQQRLFYEQNKV